MRNPQLQNQHTLIERTAVQQGIYRNLIRKQTQNFTKMSCKFTTPQMICLLLLFFAFLGKQTVYGQETSSELTTKSAYHNQLFFNRFLINPTFSLVRENKSYINILHRNQYAAFEDNSQNYFLGFSNKINDNTALGISVYSQSSGVVQEFGFNANYAKSIRLGAKSRLAFGTNITYFNEGLNKNRVVVSQEDLKLSEARKENKLAIQPGVTLSIGKFDFGLYAEDFFRYNQTANSFLTSLNGESLKASIQYNHSFMATRGLFANARLMPLVRLGKNEDGSLAYIGSMLLDLPNYGWVQATYDETYGLSTGLGFNLSKKMSIGYLLEKDLRQDDADLGWNHEISLAYTFKGNESPGAYASNSEDEKVDRIIRNYEEQILRLQADNKLLAAAGDAYEEKRQGTFKNEESQVVVNDKKQKRRAKRSRKADFEPQKDNSLAYENSLILDELMMRQDSIEESRTLAFEKRFKSMVLLLRNDVKQNVSTQLKVAGKEEPSLLASAETGPEKAAPLKLEKRSISREDFAGLPSFASIDMDQKTVRQLKTAFAKIDKSTDLSTGKVHIEKTTKNASAASGSIANVETGEQSSPKHTTTVANIQDNTKATTGTTDKILQTKGTKERDELPKATAAASSSKAIKTKEEAIASKKEFEALPIKVLGQSNAIGVKSGYYVIANVYKTKKYLVAFMETLKKKGLNPKQFYNKQNGLHYVYLADFNYKTDAKEAYVSHLDGKYNDEKWILEVADNSSIIANTSFN